MIETLTDINRIVKIVQKRNGVLVITIHLLV